MGGPTPQTLAVAGGTEFVLTVEWNAAEVATTPKPGYRVVCMDFPPCVRQGKTSFLWGSSVRQMPLWLRRFFGQCFVGVWECCRACVLCAIL